MRETLKHLLAACLKEVDPLAYPSQILCLAESVSFTRRCEEAIKSGKLNALSNSLEVNEIFRRRKNQVAIFNISFLVFF